MQVTTAALLAASAVALDLGVKQEYGCPQSVIDTKTDSDFKWEECSGMWWTMCQSEDYHNDGSEVTGWEGYLYKHYMGGYMSVTHDEFMAYEFDFYKCARSESCYSEWAYDECADNYWTRN